jgi:PAS domain S-box-containing protein
MKGENTMKEQLVNEFEELRQRTAEFQHSGAERKGSEEALRESEERYRALVEDMPALVCRFLLDGTLTFVNSSYCKYFDRNSEDLIGENFFQFIPEKDREKVRNHFQSLTHERPMVTYEHQVITPNGEIRWQRWTDRALFDGQGNLLEYQSMGFDITEHKRAGEIIKRRLEFERTVSTISSRFINVSDIDDAINASLGDMGLVCGVSRTYLFLLHQDGAVMDNTHEWCAEGVSPQIDNLQNLPCEMFPWWMRKLHKGAVIHIRDVSKMPAEAKAEKEILENQDIKSLLVLPICLKGELAGFIGFDNVMEAGRWRDDDLALLRTSSEIIGNALERKRSEEALRESQLKFRTLFDLSPQPRVYAPYYVTSPGK